MKAIVCVKYGSPSVLQFKEIEKQFPKSNEVLIKIIATTVTASDCKIRKGLPKWSRLILGIKRPRKQILGIEFAGEIVQIGKNVTMYKTGERVFGATMAKMSCHAEYICLKEKAGLSTMPENMSYEHAAAFSDGALTALKFMRDIAKIKTGQKILIIGASGSVGSYALQLAKYFGAEVTGVCSTSNVELLRNLGADHVFDYTLDDYNKFNEYYDVIFDAVGKGSFQKSKNILKKGGVFISSDSTAIVSLFFQMIWTACFNNKKVKTGINISNHERLNFLKTILESGQIKPVIDRTYMFENIIEAHEYVEKGHKKGNVVISM